MSSSIKSLSDKDNNGDHSRLKLDTSSFKFGSSAPCTADGFKQTLLFFSHF